MGKVIISPNPIKTAERIDMNGNVVDPKTKRVIIPKESDSIAQPTTIPPITPPNALESSIMSSIPKDDGLSVLEQIEATKRKLAELEELKKLKIAQKKKELELLEQ